MNHAHVPHFLTFFGVMAIATLIANACEGQAPRMLLKPVDMSHMELTAGQKSILKRVESAKSRVREVEVRVLVADPTLIIDSQEPMLLPLPGKKEALELKNYTLQEGKGADTKVLQFKVAKCPTILTITGNNWQGLIYVQDQIYSLQPLGKGLHAISLIDQSRLIDEP